LLVATINMALTEPPGDLATKALPLITIPRQVIRLNLRRYSDPLHWSQRGNYRFDSPTARYGVLYTSADVEAAILEVFGDRWRDTREIASAALEDYDVCEIAINQPLKAVSITGKHLNRLGTDSNFFAATDYETTQNWARAFMIHRQKPHGIRYNSRKNPRKINFAVFGTPEAKSATRVANRYSLTDYPALYPLLLSYNVDIV
jgi:hypothetical protein